MKRYIDTICKTFRGNIFCCQYEDRAPVSRLKSTETITQLTMYNAVVGYANNDGWHCSKH